MLRGRDFPGRGEEAVPSVVEQDFSAHDFTHVRQGHREVMPADEALLHDEFIPRHLDDASENVPVVAAHLHPLVDFRTTEHGCLPQGGPWSPVRESWLSPRKLAADRRGAAPVKPA
ncbi:hypothetical protein MXAN_7055 [Myxococcus xanthus DK 1622]|uniref:Uncharacterized protein n=1 Tax=Myxococcus xanthus (strain DK1622) TaxID=246197 RepID=Q1CWQ5_MYXXD|nr:hypothetical protein MXAN_7055 [Myxococcus xanthus DK 1622]